MQMSSQTVYTNVTKVQFDAFCYQARARGLNVSSNAGTVEFDRVPVEFNYNPETQILTVAVAEPHWLTPGVTIGVIHGMLATAMMTKDVPKTPEQQKYLNQKSPQSLPVESGAQERSGSSTEFSIVPLTLPVTAPVIGTAYSKTLKAINGVEPYTFAVTVGKLQGGLSLSSAGVISGTPTEVATKTPVTIVATDSSKPAQTASIVI